MDRRIRQRWWLPGSDEVEVHDLGRGDLSSRGSYWRIGFCLEDVAHSAKINVMTQARTSHSHPIRVDFVTAEKLLLPGRIGLTFAPGKKHRGITGHWDRDLDVDLASLRTRYGTDLLVSLIEEHEFTTLQIADLRERVTMHGIQILWYPIRGVSVPARSRSSTRP